MTRADTPSESTDLPAGVDHVLVSTANGTSKRYHRPSKEDADTPDCGANLHAPHAEWVRKTHGRQILFYEACSGCQWPGGDGV